jgi:hypothetical protein
MFGSPDEILRFIADEGVQFVDVRFCDLPGTMQHFTVPVESFDEKVFTDGLMFDGSSIRGFQQIHESFPARDNRCDCLYATNEAGLYCCCCGFDQIEDFSNLQYHEVGLRQLSS